MTALFCGSKLPQKPHGSDRRAAHNLIMPIKEALLRRAIVWRVVVYSGLAVLLYALFGRAVFSASDLNGFEIREPLIPKDEIHHGGPPRDGIPAIDEPRFISAAQATFLSDDDRVLGLVIGDIVRAYPIRILDFHEIVNDSFAGQPVVVSYCPLCGTGMAFDARSEQGHRRFGVSGLLYNSDVLLYDRETESLWSQIMRQAVSGPLKGQMLEQLPMAHTSWRDWRQQHPDTLVLSTDTGYRRDYSEPPYGGYAQSEQIWFPVRSNSPRYHPKELVIGLELNGQVKAYPFVELSKGSATVHDRFAGQRLQLEFDAAHRTGRILDDNGQEIPTTISFWFAWYAFFPQTEVFTASE